MNARLASILGYAREEIVGQPLVKFVAPGYEALVREQEASGGEETYEHRALCKDGSTILVEARGRNCTYRGRPARLAVVRNITHAALRESREAEAAVRREKDRLDRAAAAGRVALWEWDLSTGSIEWTSFVDAMLGYPPGGFSRTVEGWSAQVHPDDVGTVVASLDRHLRQGVPYDADYRIRRADGGYVWWHDVGIAERDAAGVPFRMAGTCVDITERKKSEEAERALQASRHGLEDAQGEIRRLAAAVEQVAQSVVITDTNGTIQYVNAAFTSMTGHPREAALGANPRILRSGQHDEPFYADLWRTILSGATWRGRFTNRKKDGSLYEAEAIITPVRDSLGNVSCFVCLEKDVTEVLAQQRRREEQEKLAMIGEVAANIAHEVKNPLFAISSGIQLLMEELVLDADQRRTFEVIHGDVVRMDRLVRQLQLLSSRRPLEPTAEPAAKLVEGALRLNRGLTAEKGLRIATSFPADLPDLWIDADQIHQVLVNLLQNAISYSPPGGTISIEAAASPARDRVVLRVRNEGPSIPENLVERIFEPFFTTRHPSAGMGLAISRRIAIDHGGSLRTEPHPGGGAIFALELPAGTPS